MNTTQELNSQLSEGFFETKNSRFWNTQLGEALKDIIDGTKSYRLWVYMALTDIRRRYRRTILGPFWATISLSIFIGSMSFLFSYLWKTDIASFLPFFASGFIFWVFISTIIQESCNAFVSMESLLKQISFPYFTFAWVVLVRNLFVLAHHSLVFLLIMLFLKVPVNFNTFLFIPGILLISITSLWVSLLIGLICTRYRDLQQVIQSLLQISMFVTPIFWAPSQLSGARAIVCLDSNPLYHFINIVRSPLLGQAPELKSWVVTGLITILGSLFTMSFFAKYRNRLIFWL